MRTTLLALLTALALLPFSNAAAPPLAPSAPQNLEAEAEVGGVLLRWDAPAEPGLAVTGYRVYRDGAAHATTAANATFFRDRGLAPGETRAYAVAALTLVLEGERSASVDGSASLTPPAPGGLVALGGYRSATLRWHSHGGDAFRVYRDGALVAETSSNASYVDAGLADGTTYVYAVSAVHLGNEGARSNEAAATTDAAPGAPRNLTASGQAGAILLRWSPPAAGRGNWTNGTGAAPTYRVYADLGGWTLVGETNGTSFTDRPVPAGEARCYVVRAANHVGEGPDSNQACATAYGPPSAPRDLTATPTNASIFLDWEPPADDGGSAVREYRVYVVSSNGTRTRIGSTSANATSFHDRVVLPGETRTYVVRALNAAGEGPESNAATATRP